MSKKKRFSLSFVANVNVRYHVTKHYYYKTWRIQQRTRREVKKESIKKRKNAIYFYYYFIFNFSLNLCKLWKIYDKNQYK